MTSFSPHTYMVIVLCDILDITSAVASTRCLSSVCTKMLCSVLFRRIAVRLGVNYFEK